MDNAKLKDISIEMDDLARCINELEMELENLNNKIQEVAISAIAKGTSNLTDSEKQGIMSMKEDKDKLEQTLKNMDITMKELEKEYAQYANPKIKLHARVTKEIEITQEQAEKLVNYLCGSSEGYEYDDILQVFTDNIDSGDYEAGYIPFEWLLADLQAVNSETREYLEANLENSRCQDIDL